MFDNYETVDISVIVHVRNYETEELMEKVKNYYSNLRGMPDELCIRLYNSKKEFTSGTVFLQKMFIKESD